MNARKPIDFDELFPGRFIKAGMLRGRKVTKEIADYDLEELPTDKGPQQKLIITFRGSPMQWVVNKTNGLCLKAMFGRKAPDWVGKRVTLYPDKHNGDDCIRVWGSPDIASDMDAEIRLPRKKPQMRKLHRVVPKGAQQQQAPEPPPEREPGEDDYDHDTGEVA